MTDRIWKSVTFTWGVYNSILLCTLCPQLLRAANPIMPGADPHALVLGDTVWIYPTEARGGGDRFFAYSSTDLRDWQRHGPVLDFKDVAWIKDDGQDRHHAWAPAVLAREGKYYFYHSVGPQNPTPSRIGVAVGDTPHGPFRDSSRPLLTGGNGFEAIDPMVFADPKSGTTYLYAGGSAGAKLRVFELNPDLVSLAREVPVETPPQFTEGAFMHYHDGRYYLSYSHGGWQHSSYSVHYATSETPTGPWTYRGVILSGDATRKGPGHHSFIRCPHTGQWRIVYHRWENRTGDGPYRGQRQICIDAMEYDENGRIRPVVMTSQAQEQASGTFTNPINPGPDPWMTYYRGNYYLTTTQGDCIRMWKAPTLAGLKTARGAVVWRDADPSRSHGIWAPEFHFIDGRWYLYYTAMAATRVDTTHRMHVLESEGDDPLGPYHYKGRLFDPANDFYAIDGSVFQHPGDGAWYFLWAAHPGHRIRIARMANPWALESPSVQLEASGFWCEEVREGPVVLRRNGRLFLTYSACDTGKPDYRLGMLIADERADVMDPSSWAQHPEPVFERNDPAGVFGPGHHGFFQSPDGTEDWIVYHGKTSAEYTYAGRRTRAQKFTWSADGLPVFGKPLSLDTVLAEPSSRKKSAAAVPARMRLEYENPVWDGYLADPQVLKTGGEYYAYGTGPEHNGRQFPVLHSKDFANWEFLGNALETLADPKVKAYWAPEVAEKDGRFYLYYAGEYKMRVAVADHPAGPFKDAGRILFPDEPFSIDGHPYRDPKSGKWYLFFAKDFLDQRVGTALAVAELSDDMISVTGPVRTVLRAVGDWQIYQRNRTMYGQVFDAWHTVEAPFVVLRDGRYTCFYSGGNWQTPGYGVGFAISDQVTGPYRDQANLEGATVLKSIPGKLIGPGHNSVVLGPDDQTHFIVYHSWNPERTKRQMCLDPIEWTPQGPRADNPSRGKRVVILRQASQSAGGQDNGPPTKEVLAYLRGLGNGSYLFGQVATWVHNENPDMDHPTNWLKKVYDHTGKMPRYGTVTYDFHDDPFPDAAWNSAVKEMWDRGMIVGVFSFYANPAGGSWNDPLDIDPIFAPDDNPTKRNFYKQMDRMAANLQWLKDQGVPVVYTPFVESDDRNKWHAKETSEHAIKLYRLVHDYFKNDKGLDHILWAYHTTANHGAMEKYYPGDAYVDVLGKSAYGMGLDFSEYDWAVKKKRSAGKVIWWSELGIRGRSDPPRDCMDVLRKLEGKYPELAGFVFWSDNGHYNVVGNENGPELMASPKIVTLE